MFQRVSAAPCPHRPPCPGCPRYGEPGIAPRARDALDALAAAAGLPPPVLFDAPGLSSRHRARLMVRGRTRTPKIGLFQLGSHRIVDIPQCRIHHPLINRVAAAVRAAARDAGLEPYADRPHRGALRAIQVVSRAALAECAAGARRELRDPGPVAELAAPLARALGAELHSVWWNGNPQRANTILGPRGSTSPVPTRSSRTWPAARSAFPPGAFGPEPSRARRAHRAARAALRPEGARVVEFHAGCGPLGMGLLARAERVTVQRGERGRARRARARDRAAPDTSARARSCARVPPRSSSTCSPDGRRGDRRSAAQRLEPALLDALCAAPPERLVWVSCGLDAFLAQAALLLERSRCVCARSRRMRCSRSPSTSKRCPLLPLV
jgi:tRNA/tmRNA/rRNA uracil-C5-methylase (TrmA/RlmC/RlmD family)